MAILMSNCILNIITPQFFMKLILFIIHILEEGVGNIWLNNIFKMVTFNLSFSTV